MTPMNQIESDMQTRGQDILHGTHADIRFLLKAPGFFEVRAKDRHTGKEVTGSMSYNFLEGGVAFTMDAKQEHV